MCYTTSITMNADHIEIRFEAKFRDRERFKPVYSASAFSFPFMPVISNEEPDIIDFYQWGLIPFWVKDENSTKQIKSRTLNARAETIFEKPAFRHSIRSKRCLVLANGFYEWRHENNKKYPYYIKLKNRGLFALAGIWDSWLDEKTGNQRKTFSIITTQANSLLEKIHNTRKRMPVILKRPNEKRWLEPDLTQGIIGSMLVPFDADKMEAYPVRRLFNKVGFNITESLVVERYLYSELPDID